VLNHANNVLVGGSLKDKMSTAMSWLYDLHWKVVDGKPETYHGPSLAYFLSRKRATTDFPVPGAPTIKY
jgi:hypothetical protein